jgi:type II secretory pathway component PulK
MTSRLNHRQARRGSVLVVALVCAIILTAIVAALAKKCAARRGLRRWEERRMQSEWLARAGLERASVKLARDPKFTGETWEIAPAALGTIDGGVVTIAVENVKGKPTHRLVRVVADYPREESRRSRNTIERELVPGGIALGDEP